ncbi:MAG: prephenate dehydratase [Hyphomicrobiaceae bacterium TMED74]|nr:prephenate dehydratase [Filomicrobium sp.]RPG44298.1 MAG: prephenate dehydratase [Hyphomicrobiaceae bacterium TMED74]
MSTKNSVPNKIAYQGEDGANSHVACAEAYPDLEPIPCPTFEDAVGEVKNGRAKYAMIPIENTLAGRVADVHHLLPQAELYIVGEHFLPIHLQLVAPRGAQKSDITDIYSHVHALGQCRKIIRELGATAYVSGDTAGAARQVSEWKDNTKAALSPRLAADIYDLDILAENVEDEEHNTTRFVVLSGQPEDAEPDEGPCVTTFIFRVRNVPAALYKAMGGFATNGVNMTKLESYQIGGAFTATMFYADIEGHPSERPVRLALEELSFFSSELNILGTYKASDHRAKIIKSMELPHT